MIRQQGVKPLLDLNGTPIVTEDEIQAWTRASSKYVLLKVMLKRLQILPECLCWSWWWRQLIHIIGNYNWSCERTHCTESQRGYLLYYVRDEKEKPDIKGWWFLRQWNEDLWIRSCCNCWMRASDERFCICNTNGIKGEPAFAWWVMYVWHEMKHVTLKIKSM